MYKTMKERAEAARKQQKEISEKRINKKNKYVLSQAIIPGKKREILKEQLGACGICTKLIYVTDRLVHLDHDHDTGNIRGILCHNCNVGLGHFKHNIDIMQCAIDYMKKHDYAKPSPIKALPVHPSWTTPIESKPFVKPDWWIEPTVAPSWWTQIKDINFE